MNALGAELRRASVIVCAGAGGVGKTTIAAAAGLAIAASGRRVAVVTIDPALRLAEALGLAELGNEPRLVDPELLAQAGMQGDGQLWAMMLDAKRTFDEVIEQLAPDRDTRDRVLANPIYRHLSSAIAGSQEYTAIAKLHELAQAGRYDAIVLDTPPSRNALDFLDAPGRLIRFLEGSTLRLLLAPSGAVARAASLAFAALRGVTGVSLLADLTTFFRLIAGMLSGFRERAAAVERLLSSKRSGFLIVTSPQHRAVEEAIRFAAQLESSGMRRLGLVVNRVHPLDPGDRGPKDTSARLRPMLGADLADRVAQAHAEMQQLARRDAAQVRRLGGALPGLEPVCLVDRERDVHDVAALGEVARELMG